MTNSMQQFAHATFGEVRVIIKENEPWFVAKDVASILGYANPSNAVQAHCKAKENLVIPKSGMTSIVPERDVYRLIMKSRLPQAEQFEEWVVGEVLPTIRKHGMFATAPTIERMLEDPDSMITILQTLKQEREQRKIAEAQRQTAQATIEANRPKVLFAESVEVADDTILVGDLAKLIKQSTGYNIGQNRMFGWLRENGYLHKQGSSYNMPTQRSMDLKIFVVKEGTRTSADGTTKLTRTTKVTGKGQTYFVNKFLEIQSKEQPLLQ